MNKIKFLPVPRAFHIQWHVTNECNSRCKHCYMEPLSGDELSKEQIFNIIDQYAILMKAWNMNNKLSYISWSGGEPLLRKDFFEILEKCKENGELFGYSVMSNGSAITDSVAQKLKQLGVSSVQISIEGMEETNDEIRGKGSFKKIINAFEILKAHGIESSASMTITRKNAGEMRNVAEICERAGASVLSVSRLIPMGNGREMEKLLLNPLEFRDLISEMKKINREFYSRNSDFEIKPGCGSPIWQTDGIYFPGIYICSGGSTSLAILPNGDVYPCRRYPELAGNLRNSSLFEIFYGSEKLWKIRNKMNTSEACKQCKHMELCGGGSKCNSWSYFGNPFAPDPDCWHVFKTMPDKTACKGEGDAETFSINRGFLYTPGYPTLKEIQHETECISGKDGKVFLQVGAKRMEIGNKIMRFLESENRGSKIANPLPRCIFSSDDWIKLKGMEMPESCSECGEFFKSGKFCENLTGMKSWMAKYMNANQALEYSMIINEKNMKKECFSCIWRLRNMCDMKCFQQTQC